MTTAIGKRRRFRARPSVFRLGEAGQGQEFCVDHDEEAFGLGEDRAVWVLDLGVVEELAALAAYVSAGKDQGLEEGYWPKVVDLHVASHGEDVERPVELAHRFVKERGDDASVDVAGRAFVVAVELKVAGGDGVCGVACIGGEDEVQALGVRRAAAEAVIGPLIDGGVTVHGGRGVAGCVGRGHRSSAQ